jgi:acyl carrier protein
MSDVDVLSTVQMIAADLFEMEASEISESFSPDSDARWDSLKHLGLVTAVEDEFDTTFEPEEIEEMKDIGTIVKMIEAKRDS